MAFDSFEAFVSMGGHGPYVWACYIVFFVMSFVLIQQSRARRRVVMQDLAHRQNGADTAKTDKAGADFARVDPAKH
jgi:heme exporter protein D